MTTFTIPVHFRIEADTPETATDIVNSFCGYGMEVANDEGTVKGYDVRTETRSKADTPAASNENRFARMTHAVSELQAFLLERHNEPGRSWPALCIEQIAKDLQALRIDMQGALSALSKSEAIFSQLQDNPQQAADIVRQGYFGHAIVSVRTALAECKR